MPEAHASSHLVSTGAFHLNLVPVRASLILVFRFIGFGGVGLRCTHSGLYKRELATRAHLHNTCRLEHGRQPACLQKGVHP